MKKWEIYLIWKGFKMNFDYIDVLEENQTIELFEDIIEGNLESIISEDLRYCNCKKNNVWDYNCYYAGIFYTYCSKFGSAGATCFSHTCACACSGLGAYGCYTSTATSYCDVHGGN